MNLAFVGKLAAKCKGLGKASSVALASVAQSLLGLRGVLLEDLKRIKDANLKSIEAKSVAEQAEAEKKIAEAASATNKVTEAEHEKAMRALELQEKAIRNRMLEAGAAAAEAKADKGKADAAKAKAKALESLIEVYDEARKLKIEAAENELVEALRQYTQQGGRLLVDSNNLKSLLQLKDKPQDPDPPTVS